MGCRILYIPHLCISQQMSLCIKLCHLIITETSPRDQKPVRRHLKSRWFNQIEYRIRGLRNLRCLLVQEKKQQSSISASVPNRHGPGIGLVNVTLSLLITRHWFLDSGNSTETVTADDLWCWDLIQTRENFSPSFIIPSAHTFTLYVYKHYKLYMYTHLLAVSVHTFIHYECTHIYMLYVYTQLHAVRVHTFTRCTYTQIYTLWVYTHLFAVSVHTFTRCTCTHIYTLYVYTHLHAVSVYTFTRCECTHIYLL